MGATKWSVIAVLLLVSSPTEISATASTSGSGDALTSASGSGVPSGSGLSASGSGFSGASGSGLSGSTSGSASGSAFSGGVRDSGSGSGLSASGSGFSGASGSGLSGSTSGSASGSGLSGSSSGSGSAFSGSTSGFGSAFSGSTSGSGSGVPSGSGLSASGSGFSGASGSGLSGSTSGSTSGSGFSRSSSGSASGSGLSASGSGFSGASGSGLSGSTSGSASGSAFSGGVRDSGSGSGLSASGSGFSGASGSGLSGSSSASGSAFSGSTSGSASGSGLSASGSGFSGASGSGLSGSTSGSASGSGFSGSTSSSGSGSGLSGSTSGSASGSGFSGSAGLSGSGSGSGSAFSGSTSGSGSGSGLSGSTSSSASGSAFSGSSSGSGRGSGFSGSAGLSGSGSGSGSAFSGSTSGSASGSGFSGSAGLSGSGSGSAFSGSISGSGSGSAFSGSTSGSASGSGFSGSAGLSGSGSGSGLSGSTSGSGSAFSGSSSASASGSGFSGSAGLSGSASGSTFSGSTSSSGSGSASGSGSSSGSGQSGNVSSGSGPFLPEVAPTVAPIPPTVVVLSLSTATTLTCSASGVPVPLITWTVAGSEIVEDGRIDISLSFDSDNNSVVVSQLVIQELAFEDRGTYTCTATNTGGSDATTADLIVVVPPSLSIVGAPQAALTEGDILQLACLGSGSWPSPVLSWSVDDSLVLESDGRINISSGALESERGLFFALSTLTIASVVLSDSGVYGCSGRVTVPQLAQPIPPSLADPVAISVQARNECIISTGPLRTPCVNGYCVDLIDAYACICFNGFEGVNCTDPVIVVIPPVIIEGPVNETYQLGQPVTVACQVSGNELQFEWFRDDQLLENETLPFLVIASVQPADRGNYVCAVSNEAGSARSFPGLLLLEGVRVYAARFALPLQRQRRQRRQEGDQTQALETLAANLTGVAVLPGSNITITSATIQMESPLASEATLILTVLSQAEGGAYPEGGVSVSGALVSVVTPVADELGFTLLAIERQDGCPLDEDGLYTWPESELAELLALSCPCGALDTLTTINIEASRVCGGSFSAGVEWLAPDTAACQFDAIAESLCQTTTLPTVEMSEAIVEALTATANTTVEPVDVSIASEIIFEIIEDTLLLDQTGDNVLTAIDQLLETDASVFRQSQEDTRATTRLLDGIETLSDSINLGEDNSTTFIRNTFSLLIEEQDIASFTGAVFNAIVGQATTVLSTSSTSEDQTTESSASLSIPQSLLDEIAQQFETLSVRFTYAVFNDDTLFQRPEENFENLTLGSIIISAALTNVTVANLATNIVVNFTKNEDAIRNGTLNEVCAFWDPELFDGFGGFSTDGCRMAMNTSNFTLCECDHLTSFALLLDVSPELVSPPLALEVITYVGLIFSILCLVLTILTYLISPKLRRLETGITLVHMCFALLGLYIAFIISGQALPLPDAACGFFAALLQFFMLAYFFWTAAEALLLYFKLVRVFSTASFNKKLLIAFHIVCWVTPVLIVGASLGGYQFYFNDTFCRPTSWPFWFGFVAPFLCILLFNWVVFILIMVALCRHANQSEKKDRKSAVLRQLFIAMVLSLLFGLGWVFGLLASHDLPAAVHVPSQYIFSIFVGLQGVLIFILHAVRSADARNEWKRWWYTLTCRSEKYRLVRRRTLASSQTPAASNATLRKANPPVTDDSSVPQTTPWEETVELSDFHLAKAEESLIAPAEESDADDAVALKDFHDADYVAMKEPEKMVESSVTVVVNVRATREQGKAGEQSEDFPEKLE